jgi:sec-independent protein translocase protein TatC
MSRRSRLIACLVVLGLVFGLCYWQSHAILRIVNRPLQSAQPAGTHGDLAMQHAAASAPTEIKRESITLGVAEPYVTTFTVAGYAALLLTLPFILYQAYAFALPASPASERRVALPLTLMVPVLFVAGVVFGYFEALPRAVGFAQNYNSQSFDILIRDQDYYKFAIVVPGYLGLLFQIPVGCVALSRLGVVHPQQLARNRGYVVLVIAILAAVATPTPEPVTVLLTMAPMVVVFEGSVLLARILAPRAPR